MSPSWSQTDDRDGDFFLRDTLSEVVVTTRQAERRVEGAQVGAERLDVRELLLVPTLMGERDILKSLQLLPGVKGEGDGLSGYEVRGGTSVQNLVLLDRSSIYNAGHMMGLFSMFNDDVMGTATLYKGMLPAQLGGATSSVLDIDTRRGDMQTPHHGFTVGLISAKAYAEGPLQRGRSSFLVAGRRSYLDFFLKPFEDYKHDKLSFYDVNLRLSFDLSRRDRLDVSLFRGHDNISLDGLMYVNWTNTTASAHWRHTFSDRLQASTHAVFSHFPNGGGFSLVNLRYGTDGYVSHLTLREQLSWRPTPRHDVNLGAETTRLRVQSAKWTFNTVDEDETRSAWMTNLWLNDEWRPSQALTLSAGVRLNLFSVLGGSPYYDIDADGNITRTFIPRKGSALKTYVEAEPRLSAKLSLGRLGNLRMGYSRTTQHVQAIHCTSLSLPIDRYTMTSNLVRPQTAHQVALGWTAMTRQGSWDFSAEAYLKRIDHVYDYRDGAIFYSAIEIERLLLEGRGRAYGLETAAHKNTGRLTGWAAYTLSWSQNKIAHINQGRWYTAPNDRRHDLVLVAMYDLSPAWQLSAAWRCTTGQAMSAPSSKYEIDGTTYYYYTERNGYRAPTYHRLDVAATHTRRLRRATRMWTVSVYNAYNRYNPFLVQFRDDDRRPSGTKAVVTSLLGIVPSVSYTLKY